MLSTSINVKKDFMSELREISEKYHISISELIKRILHHVYRHLNKKIIINELTHYQKKDRKKRWKCFRIDFSENECTLNFKVRCKYRISLSKLLFVGFILFIEDVIAEIASSNNESDDKILNSYTAIIEKYWPLIQKELRIFEIELKKPK